MIKKIFKWTGIVLGSIIVLTLIAYAAISHNISARMDKRYSFLADNLDIPADSGALARGRHLVAIKGCNDCHGSRLEGKVMVDDGAVGRISASNLTRGKGGLPDTYSTDDWVTAMRHGVDKHGRPLLFMPSHETTLLTESDLAAIIAYCRQLPAVDHQLPANDVGPVARIMTYFDKMPLLSVEKIAHNQPMQRATDTARGVVMGKYLSVSCSGCHRPDMKGGAPLAPGFPPVPDITATGHPGRWTQAQFIATLRTGKTPAGHQMKPDDMPWKMTAQYEEKELASLYQYLQTLK